MFRRDPVAPFGTIILSTALARKIQGGSKGRKVKGDKGERCSHQIWRIRSENTARPDGRNQTGRLDRLRNCEAMPTLQSCPV